MYYVVLPDEAIKIRFVFVFCFLVLFSRTRIYLSSTSVDFILYLSLVNLDRVRGQLKYFEESCCILNNLGRTSPASCEAFVLTNGGVLSTYTSWAGKKCGVKLTCL